MKDDSSRPLNKFLFFFFVQFLMIIDYLGKSKLSFFSFPFIIVHLLNWQSTAEYIYLVVGKLAVLHITIKKIV